CMGCHRLGIKGGNGLVRDQVRVTVEKNAFAYTRAEVDAVRLTYADQATIDQAYVSDKNRFGTAMQKLGWDMSNPIEPATTLAKRFDGYVEPQLAAAELGISLSDFLNGIQRSRFLTRRMGSILLENGTVDR